MREPEMLRLSFAEELSETVLVTVLAPNVCRLEETPVSGAEFEVYLGDTIETELQADGSQRFVRAAERAEQRHYGWLVPQQFVDSQHYREFGAAVEAAGGRWEGIMGGWLLVHIPVASEFNAEAELERHIAAAMEEAPGATWRSGRAHERQLVVGKRW